MEPIKASLAITEYVEFVGETTSTATARPGQLLEEVLAIISNEGPVLGSRIFTVHTRCSGGQRVGPLISETLKKILSNAVRKGLVVEEDPLDEGDRRHRTYRLPIQPDVRQRTLGPRTLELVPPRELAALMEALRDRHGLSNDDALDREVLNRYRLKRRTPKTLQRLHVVKTKLVE